MPRTRSLAWSELRIGVVTIAALVITAMTIFLLTGDAGFSWQQYRLKTRFPNVAGLKSGSPVRLAGLEVGTVREVTLAGEEVEVTFTVREDYQPRITTGSEARLGSVSLLGEAAVDISPSSEGTPIPEWGYVRTGRTAAQLADITDQASQGIDQLTGLLTDIRGGRGTVGKLMTDDQLYAELRRFVSTAGDLAQGIRQGEGTLGRLVNDPATAQALEGTLANLETMTRQINAGEGSLGRLMRDDTFSRNLTSATSNIDALVARLNSGDGTAGRLINDPALYNRLNAVTERIDLLIARLNDGEGTAGLLLKDRQLYENMNKVTADMSALIAEIRKDPRRFLPSDINISIF
jgi:phospholipid/cholesterol/gamma-HCH transport system substrate-binding protein